MFKAKPATLPYVRPKARVAPKMIRARSHPEKPLPTASGKYFWSEWNAIVDVTKRGGSCYVTPPAKTAVEVRITNNIAGRFYELKPISP